MSQIININPTNYVAKLKEHVAGFVKDGQVALKNAQELVIKTDEDLKLAKEDWVKHRETQKLIEEDRTGLTGPLNDALKLINSTFKEADKPLSEARDILNSKVQARQQELNRIREEADRKAREAAAKEEARLKAIKDAQESEWRRKEAEAKAEAIRLENEVAKAKGAKAKAAAEEAAQKARDEAAKAQAKADERAEQSAAVFVPASIVEKTEVKVSGAKKVVRYYARVIDPKKVPVEWSGKILRPVDEKALNELARGLKTTVSPIEGVQFYSEESLG